MRIGIITPFYYPNIKGGSEVSVKLLAEKMLEQGHDVTVISFDSNFKFNCFERIDGVLVYRYKVLFQSALLLTLLPFVFEVIRKWETKVDIFHIYGVYPLAGAGFYKLLGGKEKVIATLNNYSAFCPIGTVIYDCARCTISARYSCLRERKKNQFFSIVYSFLFPSLKWLCKRIDGYIALSCAVKNLYVTHNFDERKIRVIPNFFDFESITAGETKKVTGKKFNILYMGSLTKSKGVAVLINAFYKVAIKNPDVTLTIVGDGEEINNLRKLVNSFNLEKQVKFAGYVKGSERYAYFLNADLFVHPSIWPEPFGRTILEAMAFEVPLIVSNVGAPPEIIENAGLIFQKGNITDLQDKIEFVLQNSDYLNEMKNNCKKVLDNYQLEKICEKILLNYKKF